jgi:hypothetical protein
LHIWRIVNSHFTFRVVAKCSSKFRSTMNRFSRSDNCVRAVVAGFILAAFFWTLVLSASPQLHQRMHSDANRGDHTCAVTLLVSGNYDHAAPPPLIRAPRLRTRFSEAPAVNSTWVQSLILKAHIFAHAPPALG